MIRAVIFDMGNTLLHYVHPGSGSWREMEDRGIRSLYRHLQAEGHQLHVPEATFVEDLFVRLALGWEHSTAGQTSLHAADWIAAGVAAYGCQLEPADLAGAVAAYTDTIRAGVVAIAGAQAALAELRARGCQIGLISNTIWPGALHLADLEQLGLREYLEYTVFSGDAGVWKPSAAIFQRVLDGLGVEAAEAVFVGDNPREDILGAQALGLRAILVRGEEFALGAVQPDAIIADQTELLAVLGWWGF